MQPLLDTSQRLGGALLGPVGNAQALAAGCVEYLQSSQEQYVRALFVVVATTQGHNVSLSYGAASVDKAE